MRPGHCFKSIAAFVVLTGLASLPASSGTISLSWSPAPGASGYRVHYGTGSGQYTGVVDAGPDTEVTLAGLQDCTAYHVAVKAYNGAGESTAYSNEIIGWARPEISATDPTVAMQGDQLTLRILGSNFDEGAQVVFDATDIEGDPLISIDSLSVVSCNEIQAAITVEATARGFRAAEVGQQAFKVLNPGSVFGARSVEVSFDPERLDINRSDAMTLDRVDGKDLVWLSFAHASREGEPRYNADADLNGDGLVDGDDLAYLVVEFGSCWDGIQWSMDECS